MSYPLFHPDEEARIGPYAYDHRMIGRVCKVESLVSPIGGEWRYAVSTPSGMYTIVLESTLEKVFEPCNANLEKIWPWNRIPR